MWKAALVVGISVVNVAVAMAVTVVNTLDTDEAVAGKKKPCPAGMKRFVRVCIEKEPHEEQVTYQEASATCAAAKRRLPTLAEIDAYRQ